MASSSGAGHRPRSPPTRKCAGFIWGTTSGWIKFSDAESAHTSDGRNRVRPASYGDFSEAAHKARPEADSDAVAPTGDQAPAYVYARAVGAPQPGNGREPDARRGPDGRAPAGRGYPGKTGRQSRRREGEGRHLGRPGLRV